MSEWFTIHVLGEANVKQREEEGNKEENVGRRGKEERTKGKQKLKDIPVEPSSSRLLLFL